MLVVKVELHSAITGEIKEIDRIIIDNDGTGDKEIGNYTCYGFEPDADFDLSDWRNEVKRSAGFKGHRRFKEPVLKLVWQCLGALGYSDSK